MREVFPFHQVKDNEIVDHIRSNLDFFKDVKHKVVQLFAESHPCT